MTDFIDTLLTSMSTKFNEVTDVADLNLADDKTLKWRGLLNNKYASASRRKEANKKTANETPSVSAIGDATKVDCVDNGDKGAEVGFIKPTTGTKAKDKISEISSDTVKVGVNNKGNKPKRLLRRKQNEKNNIEKISVLRRKKRNDLIKNNLVVEPGKQVLTATKPTTTKKVIKETPDEDHSEEPSKSENKDKTNSIDAIPLESKPIQVAGEKPPKLRRSERTQNISIEPDKSDCYIRLEHNQEENSIKPDIYEFKPDEPLQEQPKKPKKKIEQKPNNDISNTEDLIENSKRKRKTTIDDQEQNDKIKCVSNENETNDLQEKPEQPSSIVVSTEVIKTPDVPTTDKITEDILKITKELLPMQLELKTPKKRGRKPGTKMKPKLFGLTESAKTLKTVAMPLKKSPRLSKDGSDSVLASAIARREKINEQIIPQQRLSRRIKPTAKILANEELRHGFELQNNARLSISNEHLDNELDRSPKQEIEKKPDNISKAISDDIVPIDQPNESQLSEDKVKRVLFTKEKPVIENIEILRPPRRPCPDTETFLNEIKLAKINLHRSPEGNKKLSIKQKRRLFKLKEKHLNKLGLQKTSKPNSESSLESNESDDAEEFVPNKKINVGRPSVTLRVRNQRECSTEISHLKVIEKEKQIIPSKELRKKSVEFITSVAEIYNKKRSVTTEEPTELKEAARCLENSLLLSIKHKISDDSISPPATPVPLPIKLESLPTICLCNKTSKYYTQKTLDTIYCRAIDEIEAQEVGCCNEVDGELINLLRPSVRVSYMILCKSHKQRLVAHNSCAGCGVFCTQGRFILCSRNHFFHRDCATKFILNSPFDPQNPDFTCPTLVLRCPHCGIDAPEHESMISMKSPNVPVFLPSQRQYKPAKMSIGLHSHNSVSKKRSFLVELEKLIPESVVDLVVKAQNSFPFSRNSNYTTKDVFYAINKNDIEHVAEIIASGFDITTTLSEFHHGTCLHLVANFGTINMAYLILSRAPSEEFLNVVDRELRSALMCAVAGERNDILKLLVQCGADVTLKGPDGMTALHLAAKTGNFTAAQIILENFRHAASAHKFESFVNAIDDGGWTAIVWAAEIGHSEMVSYLINYGVDANVCDTENNTVLHWATLSDNIETVLPLLRSDCDFNAQNINGDTPLHIACRNSNTRICLILLAHGSSLDIKNTASETPYDCVPNENSQCARAILFNLNIRKTARFGERNIVCHDISNGREIYPIKIVKRSKSRSRSVDDEINEHALPDFKYITKTILLQNSIQIDRRISQMRICSCSDSCTSQPCQCSEISVQNWYNSEGRLNGNFNYQDPAMIFECNDVCGCNKLMCKNRVVQNGIKLALQIVECKNKIKGWGVKGLTKIVKGTFVSEYTGEILTDVEADRRTDDSYFFDLGASEHCIDANYFGNVSRFFNHSCEPNVVPIRVYFEHQDLRFPKIAFFASQDIEVGEEITFDYGEKFWLIKYKSFTCQCGAKTCRFSDKTINKTLAEYNQRTTRAIN